jgi:hypothetical protein
MAREKCEIFAGAFPPVAYDSPIAISDDGTRGPGSRKCDYCSTGDGLRQGSQKSSI